MPEAYVGNFKGPKGDKGATGQQGLQGPTGATGLQGLKGDKGDTGPKGPQGIQGPIGNQGVKGEKGERGETGPTGLRGATGQTGATGPAPTIGANGNWFRSGTDTGILADANKAVGNKIVQSINITKPGFIMDGKTASEAISALNSNLYDSGWIDLTSRVSYRIKNGYCTINASSSGQISLAQSPVTLGTLPTNARPGQTFRENGTPMDVGGYDPQFVIDATGKITGQYLKGSGSINWWAFSLTYPI